VQLIEAGGRPWDLAVAGSARTYADMIRPDGLRDVATYARAVGVHKSLVVPRDAGGRSLPPTSLVADAHGRASSSTSGRCGRRTSSCRRAAAGADPSARGDLAGEVRLFLRAGVDGFFTDFPGLGVAARDDPAR